MTNQPNGRIGNASHAPSTKLGESGIWFALSAVLFRIGLLFVTFEEVRPAGIMLSDYCFLLSLVFIPKARLFKETGSGVMLGGSIILAGAVLSLHSASSVTEAAFAIAKLVLLFGLIAPLALSHAQDIRKNLYFLASGIFINCFIVLIQASVFPGIIDMLSINPPQPDVAFQGRYQGLTEFPVTLGLSAALAVFIAVGLFASAKSKITRWYLAFVMLVCSIAALLSGSRTFLGSLVPGLLVFSIFQKKHRRSVISAVAALTLMWVAASYLAPGVVSQYSERIDTVGVVDYGRLAAAAQAILEIAEKPILGWGVDHFDEGGVIVLPETGEITGAHNTFLRYWYAAGLLGATGFLILFISPMRAALRTWRQKGSAKSTQLLPLVIGCYVFFFIVVNLGPYLYNRYVYVPMFVLAGFAVRCANHVESAQVVRRPITSLSGPKIQLAP